MHNFELPIALLQDVVDNHTISIFVDIKYFKNAIKSLETNSKIQDTDYLRPIEFLSRALKHPNYYLPSDNSKYTREDLDKMILDAIDFLKN